MRRIYFSRAFDQAAVLTRSGTGLALTFHATREVWAPAVYKYCSGFSVTEGRGLKGWTLVILDDGVPVAPEVDSDPDVRDLPQGFTLDSVLTAQQRTAVQTRLDATDFGVVLPSPVTVRQVLQLVGVSLGQSGDFNPDRLV